MRYLSSYSLIKESVSEAKSAWTKTFGDLNNPYLPYIQNILHKNPGYIGKFVKLLIKTLLDRGDEDYWKSTFNENTFIDGTNNSYVGTINRIYNLITTYKQLFPNINIDIFKNFEELEDFLNKTINDAERKSYVKSFLSSKYFHLINDKTIELFDIIKNELKLDDNLVKDLFLKKIASIHTSEEFNVMLQSKIDSLSGWTSDNLEQKAINASANIIFKNENTLIVEIPTFECLNVLGSRDWCIVRETYYWKQYLFENNIKMNKQYIVYRFDLDQTDNKSMIGITIDIKGKIKAAHYKNDDMVNDFSFIKTIIKYLTPYHINELQYNTESLIQTSIVGDIENFKKILLIEGGKMDALGQAFYYSMEYKNIDIAKLCLEYSPKIDPDYFPPMLHFTGVVETEDIDFIRWTMSQTYYFKPDYLYKDNVNGIMKNVKSLDIAKLLMSIDYFKEKTEITSLIQGTASLEVVQYIMVLKKYDKTIVGNTIMRNINNSHNFELYSLGLKYCDKLDVSSIYSLFSYLTRVVNGDNQKRLIELFKSGKIDYISDINWILKLIINSDQKLVFKWLANDSKVQDSLSMTSKEILNLKVENDTLV